MRAALRSTLAVGVLWLAAATLLAIASGAVAANAINVYSAGMAFVTTGVRLPAHVARATATVVFGVAGFLVAWWALADAAASYDELPYGECAFAATHPNRLAAIAGCCPPPVPRTRGPRAPAPTARA